MQKENNLTIEKEKLEKDLTDLKNKKVDLNNELQELEDKTNKFFCIIGK